MDDIAPSNVNTLEGLGAKLIRPANTTDTDSIIALWLAASCQAHSFIPSDYWESKVSEMRDTYIPNSETYVETDDNKVIGFISLVGDEVAALFVDPEVHGHGFGRALLSHAKSLRKRLSLSVYTQNERALGFYRHQGFEIIEERIDDETGAPETLLSWSAATV